MDQNPNTQTLPNTPENTSVQPIEAIRITPTNPSFSPPLSPPAPQLEVGTSNSSYTRFWWVVGVVGLTTVVAILYYLLPQNKLSINSQTLEGSIHIAKVQTTKPASIMIITGDQLNRPKGAVVAATNITIEPGTYTDFNIPFIKPDPESGITEITKGTYFGVLVEIANENPDDQLPPQLKNILGIPIQTKFKLL